MMPWWTLATVKERPGVVVLGVESLVALLVPRALVVVRSCSRLSAVLRSEVARTGVFGVAVFDVFGTFDGLDGRCGGRRAWSATRRFAAWAFLAAARTTSRWVLVGEAVVGSAHGVAGVAAGCGRAILPARIDYRAAANMSATQRTARRELDTGHGQRDRGEEGESG